MNTQRLVKSTLALTVLVVSAKSISQDYQPELVATEISAQIEETVVLGTLRSAAGDIILERMESESVVDIIGAEQIQRIGDSTVAQALTRVPGITLVNNQFVYVRGLGERYSSSLLNGASVPSPDLTRNVIPLDIFPSSILDSIAIEKGFTADMPASFGGGNIDIRTKGIPDEFVFSIELGTSYNSDSGDIFTYAGGSDDSFGTDDGTRALSSIIDDGLRTFRTSFDANEGDISARAIQATAARLGNPITDAEAEAANADLALLIHRDLDINEESNSFPNDLGFSVNLGDLYEVGDRSEVGFLASLAYDNSVRVTDRIERTFEDPAEEFQEEFRTTDNVSITGSFNFGWRYGDDHEIASKNLFLRNTDDDVSITNIYNTTSPFSSGQGSRNFDYRYEERELLVNQFTGTHIFGADTRDILGLGSRFDYLDELEFSWFYSDSEATTDIPSETNILANITRNVETNEITASTLTQGLRTVDVRYTDLEDNVESAGWELELPLYIGDWEIKLLGGAKFDRKLRVYEQLDLSIGSSSSAAVSTLSGSISEALSDENLTNPDFDYDLTYQSGLSRSYIASTITDAYYAQADFLWDYRWRVTLGARYEEYKQFSSPWQPYRLNGSTLTFDPLQENANGFPEGTYYEDDLYPSLAFTYSQPGFLDAEDFNLRLTATETVVRPDLREVSDASYLDPLTDIIVSGNPDVIPSGLTNYDLRAEWFFSNGDNLTLSVFYKDIENPIEYFESAGAEDTITATIENAASGESAGVEVEFLKGMEFLGSFASQFFLSGNLTIADSEIQVGDELLTSATNRVRPLTGASDYVLNLQLGYDSDNGAHSASLAYNVFGERLFTAGTGEQPDSFEQPFHSLDLAYVYYVTNNLTLKAKLRNILDNDVEITKGDVRVFEQTVGQTMALDIKYDF